MPRRPDNPRAWAGCFRCEKKLVPFKDLEAANAWVFAHGITTKHLAHVRAVNASVNYSRKEQES